MPPDRTAPVQATTDGPAAQLLAELARRIASSLELRQTLQYVVQAVVDQLGFGCAVMNLVRSGDMCEVVAIAGPEEAARALLGTRASVESWHRLLASCESWGDLRFLDHRSDQGPARPIPGWTPPIEPSDLPEAWHPDDMLLAPLHAPDGALIGVLSIDMPVDGRRPDSQRRQLLEQFAVHAALAIENSRVHTLVADSEQLFRAMFDRSPIAIALLTEDQRITKVNTACEQLLGRAAADLLGHRAPELSRPNSVRGRRSTDPAVGTHDQYEIHFTRPDGNEIWGRVNSTLLAAETGDGPSGHGPSLILTQIEDITMLRTIQANFAHAATHDRLTGLANRALVLDRLAAALSGSRQGDGRVAVLYCDLDHFKEVNDTLGHAAGDQLLVEVGRRLQRAAREQDTVGRLGGDEFVMISRQVRTSAEAARLAVRVMRAVQQPVNLCGQPALPSLSMGVALAMPQDSSDFVLATADRAMYEAKAAGRGRWHLAPDTGPVTSAYGTARALPGLPVIECVREPFDHLGEDGLRGGEVKPEGAFAAGPERGSVHHRDARAVSDQGAGRTGQVHRGAVEPGQVGTVGRPVTHPRQVPAEQVGEQPAAVVEVAEDVVQPALPVPESGDVGDHAGIARPVGGEHPHLFPPLPVGGIGEDRLGALQPGQVPRLRGGDGGQRVRRGRLGGGRVGDVPRPRIHQRSVDLVGEHPAAVPVDDVGQLRHLRLGEDSPERVVRVAEDQ
jgi:diguanylate cyclase (GGDEF)-like protein/PAS domain S-box-containing protein